MTLGIFSTVLGALPAIRVEGPLRISDEAAKAFNHSILRTPGSDSDEAIVNPLFLPALTSPVVIRILVDRACPVKPLGCVNTHNRYEFHDGRLTRNIKTLVALSQAGRLSYTGSFGGENSPGLRKKRGMEFCIRVCIVHDGYEILTQEFWYLQFMNPSVEPRYRPSPADVKKHDDVLAGDVFARQVLHMDEQDPQRWASSCKDYNPIHVSKIGARLFGFRSVIAHGNHTAALATHLFLEHQKAHPGPMVMELSDPLILNIRFERPMVLPAIAEVRWHGGGFHDKVEFSVVNNDKACVYGSYELADD